MQPRKSGCTGLPRNRSNADAARYITFRITFKKLEGAEFFASEILHIHPSAAEFYRDRIGETYSVKYNPDHQWFYVPKMLADEILLLKCFDSKTDGRARFAPHSAFADSTTPSDAPPRESIELRTLVFHKK